MSKNSDTQFYDEVVRITNVYLGPAADRFMSRQIHNHLDKEPNDLTKQDLVSLIVWIKMSVSLLTEDTGIVDEYIGKLNDLTKDTRPAGS
jgi:hypothetical protein